MTSNAEAQTKTEAGASARAPEVPTKANVAPRKPCGGVQRQFGQEDHPTPSKKATKGAKGAKPTK